MKDLENKRLSQYFIVASTTRIVACQGSDNRIDPDERESHQFVCRRHNSNNNTHGKIENKLDYYRPSKTDRSSNANHVCANPGKNGYPIHAFNPNFDEVFDSCK